MFGQVQNLLANVENCIIVTDEPSKEANKILRDRFQRERERLSDYHVKVEIVQVAQ